MPRSSRRAAAAASLLATAARVVAAPADNTFEIVGNSGVSAQQMFLSAPNKVVIIDKTEGNGNNLNINGHPAWTVEYNTDTNTVRALDITTNSFCAGGNVLGDGRWLNVGGNQPIGAGGINWPTLSAPYHDGDGGPAVRVWTPCTDNSCDWAEAANMTTRRWYPTLETLPDGSAIIIGGCDFGGYVNDAGQNNPTFEYWPSKGAPIGLNLLLTTLPANLFPHTFLLPSGNLFLNANLGNEVFDFVNNIEHPLANTPHSVRTYPGSAATAMMPLTPANNWTATIVFCGGTNLQPDQWVTTWNIAAYPADTSCISITPDVSTAWQTEDPLPEGRSMGNFILLPDGRGVILNGQLRGTAGYGNTSWAIGQSFGDGPIYAPLYYDRSKPQGQRMTRTGMGNSTVPRMYHSSALLLPDGSIFSSGSNPNADFISAGTPNYPYPTEYRVERFYPDYYTKTRPQPTGLPTKLSYGGAYFDVKLSATDAGANGANLANTIVSIVRPGFSTHVRWRSRGPG